MTDNIIYNTMMAHKPWFKEYFAPWTYNEPLLISYQTDQRVAQLQKIIHKIIVYFVKNYDDYKTLMPIDDKVNRVLSFFADTPYRVGSYRTDFVIDENKQFKLIEITCRFGMNGLWMSAFLDELASDYAKKHNLPHNSYNQSFFHYLQSRFADKDIVILSHKGKSEESAHYQKILEKAGIKTSKVYCEDIDNVVQDIDNKVFITELNEEDYFELSDFALSQLAKADLLNDLRTVFLIHDKRFFTILGNQDIRNLILTQQEQTILESFYIPTYQYDDSCKNWKDAKIHKDNWMLKHKHLGKSQCVYAGMVTEEVEWQNLFLSDDIHNMVLQPFMQQPKFTGMVHEKQHQDYMVGTMLFLDDNYFGLGLFRASSHVITNVVDDRKVLHINSPSPNQTSYQQYQCIAIL